MSNNKIIFLDRDGILNIDTGYPCIWNDVIPNPRAMLTNKKINLFNSNVSHYEMIKDLQIQWKQWTLDNPGIFISYNGHAFDEELVRRQFFWNLFLL